MSEVFISWKLSPNHHVRLFTYSPARKCPASREVIGQQSQTATPQETVTRLAVNPSFSTVSSTWGETPPLDYDTGMRLADRAVGAYFGQGGRRPRPRPAITARNRKSVQLK